MWKLHLYAIKGTQLMPKIQKLKAQSELMSAYLKEQTEYIQN